MNLLDRLESCQNYICMLFSHRYSANVYENKFVQVIDLVIIIKSIVSSYLLSYLLDVETTFARLTDTVIINNIGFLWVHPSSRHWIVVLFNGWLEYLSTTSCQLNFDLKSGLILFNCNFVPIISRESKQLYIGN